MRKIFLLTMLMYSSLSFSKVQSEEDLIKSCRNEDDVSCSQLKSRCEKNPKKSASACALYGAYRFLDRNDDTGYDIYIVKACKHDKQYCSTKETYRDLKTILTAKEECPKSQSYKVCVPLEKAREQKDIDACNSIAFHWLNRNENDAGVPYLEKSCSFGDNDSCEQAKTFSKLSSEKKDLDSKQKDLEVKLYERQADYDEQQRKQRMIQGLQQMSNFMNQSNQPTNPQQKQQRCRTVVRPGNGMDWCSSLHGYCLRLTRGWGIASHPNSSLFTTRSKNLTS